MEHCNNSDTSGLSEHGKVCDDRAMTGHDDNMAVSGSYYEQTPDAQFSKLNTNNNATEEPQEVVSNTVLHLDEKQKGLYQNGVCGDTAINDEMAGTGKELPQGDTLSIGVTHNSQESGDERKEGETEEKRTAEQFRFWKTGAYIFAFICVGLFSGITGVTQLDLRDGLGDNVTMEDLSRAQATKSLGMIVGSLLGGLVNDRFVEHTDVVMAAAAIMAGVVTVFKPLTSYLWVLAILYFLDGVGHASMNAVASPMTLMLWGESADVPMQLLHMGYGIGFVVGPLLGLPFISSQDDEEEESQTNTTSYMSRLMNAYGRALKAGLDTSDSTRSTAVNMLYNQSTMVPLTDEELDESRIQISYFIIGVITVISGLVFVVYQCREIPPGVQLQAPTKTSWRQVLSPASCADGNSCFAVAFITMLALFYAMVVAKDVATMTFLFSFAVEGDLEFSTEEAGWLDVANKFSFLVGRILGSVAAIWVACIPMLFVEVFASAAMAVGLVSLGLYHKNWLWIFSCLFSMFGAPIWASGYSWGDLYILMYSSVLAMLDIVSGLSGFFVMWFTGYLYTYVSPEATMYLTLICAILLCAVLIVGQILGSCKGRRKRYNDDGQPIDEDSHSEVNIVIYRECTKL